LSAEVIVEPFHKHQKIGDETNSNEKKIESFFVAHSKYEPFLPAVFFRDQAGP
jgi:hypothetical protein